jgi:hypothetical protein
MVCDSTHCLESWADISLLVNPDDRGPMQEYDDRVAQGRLRDDEHQRGRGLSWGGIDQLTLIGC